MKKRNKNISKIIAIILFMLIGAAVGFFVAKAGGAAASSMPAPVLITLTILFIPAFFFVIALHEGGHALAGVWMNFDFRMFVSPLTGLVLDVVFVNKVPLGTTCW